MLEEILRDEVREQDAFEGEPTPKAGILKITVNDVQALRDFEALVGGDCFDVWERDGGRSKSDILMNHLSEMRVLLAEIESTLSISQKGAKAIYKFDRHVGLDCYDVWHPNGGRFKSIPFMKQLARMRELLDKLVDYPAVETGFYTTPLCEGTTGDLHPLLAAEIGERTSVRCYSADVFLTPSLDPFGCFELLIDERANEACGLFRVPFELSERIIGPGWTECGSDIDANVQTFLDGIPDLDLVYGPDEDEDQRAESPILTSGIPEPHQPRGLV